jgi:hypothetical protein
VEFGLVLGLVVIRVKVDWGMVGLHGKRGVERKSKACRRKTITHGVDFLAQIF